MLISTLIVIEYEYKSIALINPNCTSNIVFRPQCLSQPEGQLLSTTIVGALLALADTCCVPDHRSYHISSHILGGSYAHLSAPSLVFPNVASKNIWICRMSKNTLRHEERNNLGPPTSGLSGPDRPLHVRTQLPLPADKLLLIDPTMIHNLTWRNSRQYCRN